MTYHSQHATKTQQPRDNDATNVRQPALSSPARTPAGAPTRMAPSPAPAPDLRWALHPTPEQKSCSQRLQHHMLMHIGEESALDTYLRRYATPERVQYVLALYGVGADDDGLVTLFPYMERTGHVADIRALIIDGDVPPRIPAAEMDSRWLHATVGAAPTGRPMPLCLFGEHLLGRLPFDAINVTDSELSTLMGCLWHPEWTWLALPPAATPAAASPTTAIPAATSSTVNHAAALNTPANPAVAILAGRTVRFWPPADGLATWRTEAARIAQELDLNLLPPPAAYLAAISACTPCTPSALSARSPSTEVARSPSALSARSPSTTAARSPPTSLASLLASSFNQ